MSASDLKQTLASKIKQARKRLGYTQEQLAEAASLGHAQTVSEIEKAQREVKVWELARIAEALHLDMLDFMGGAELPPKTQIAWRVEPKEYKDQIEARFLGKCETYARLENLIDYCAQRPLPEYAIDARKLDFAKAEQIADEVKRLLELGSKPALALTKVLEDDFGVKIWYAEMEDSSAASAKGDFGSAILMNLNEAPWRRNYNFAHELFHLVTWEATRASKPNSKQWSNLEKMADAFASCLLMPKVEVKDAFECRAQDDLIRFSDLVEIAREFDVSTAALLWRLYRLNKISQDKVTSLLEDPSFQAIDKSTMTTNWWRPSPLPARFVRLAFMAYQKGKLSRMQLAKYLDTSLIDLPNVLAGYGFDEWENYEVEITAS